MRSRSDQRTSDVVLQALSAGPDILEGDGQYLLLSCFHCDMEFIRVLRSGAFGASTRSAWLSTSRLVSNEPCLTHSPLFVLPKVWQYLVDKELFSFGGKPLPW